MSTTTYDQVIVGTDGSRTASGAVGVAASVAARLGVPLVVVTAWQRGRDDIPTPEEASFPGGGADGAEAMWASNTIADAAAIGRRAGVEDIEQRTPQGSPAQAMLDLSDDRPGALVVVGTVGLGDRAERLVGNVPHQLTHHCRRDLLLVHGERPHEEAPWTTVALATDGSPTAALAVERGRRFAEAVSAGELWLLAAARDEASGQELLDRAVAQDQALATAQRHVATGDHAGDTLARAGSTFDLLVLGNKGMSGPSRLLGSVANRVTHAATTDLLLVNTSR
ncbi:MAG: universal stress protein [Actinomycetes bacterium]